MAVYTAAVAGNEETRRLRACIAQETCPNLNNSLAIADISEEKGDALIPPLEMTGAKANAVRNNTPSVNPEEIPSIDKFKPKEIVDTVLIIGQVCFRFFNKQCEPLLSEIKNCPVYIQGGTGQDFNMAPEGITMLTDNECNITAVNAPDCPRFNFVEQWPTLISNYDKVALEVHSVSVGAFLTSRTATNDGAFYRQFGLASMALENDNGKGVSIMNFESKLANKVKSSNDFNMVDQMNQIISYCETNNNPDYDNTNGGKNGGKEPVYRELYKMWYEALNAETHPDLMAPLGKLILETLVEVGSPGANEYDGYTTAKMLYEAAGRSKYLTFDKHYDDLMKLLTKNECCCEWRFGLEAILNKGNLYVYHDAGLDPYVDDYIALKMLNAAKSEIDNEKYKPQLEAFEKLGKREAFEDLGQKEASEDLGQREASEDLGQREEHLGGTRHKRHKPHKKRTTKRHKPHKKRKTKHH